VGGDLTPGQVVAFEVERIESAHEVVAGGGGVEESEEDEDDDSDDDGLTARSFTNFGGIGGSGWRKSLGEAREKVLLAAESMKKAISPKTKKARDESGDDGKCREVIGLLRL
jgi:hypothetical protein